MASSPISKTSFHARSISLPSRPNPIPDQFDEQLSTLRSSQTASTSSSSLSHSLNNLKNLFECLDELLLLPRNQSDCQANCINVMLDGSLRLVDICDTARDACSGQSNTSRPFNQFMFKDVEAVAADIFKSLLIHIAGSKTQSNKSSWSLVKKLVHQASDKEHPIANLKI